MSEKQNFVDALDKIEPVGGRPHYSNEGAHEMADKILCNALEAAGWGEVADAFDRAKKRITFWYA